MASTFPQSGDENVEIYLTSDKNEKILLHSYVLALHSKWFKAKDKNRWVYELRFGNGSAFGLLARRTEPTEIPSPTTTTTEMIPRKSSATVSASKKLHKERLNRVNSHKQMLGALSHIIPTFSHQSFDSARTSILLLSEAADAYDCQHIIKIHTENHLRLYRNEVLDLCATDPVGMLELAMAVQSEWIFMEASTNLIGRSEDFFGRSEARLRGMGLNELFQKKRTEFRGKLSSCEMKMFLMQPTPPVGLAAQISVDFFRQWLSEQLQANGGSNLRTGYASLYHTISRKAGSIATNVFQAPEVTNFLSKLGSVRPPYLETHLRSTYVKAATIIAPIIKDATRRQDKTDDKFRALTCMTIDDDEIRWLQKK